METAGSGYPEPLPIAYPPSHPSQFSRYLRSDAHEHHTYIHTYPRPTCQGHSAMLLCMACRAGCPGLAMEQAGTSSGGKKGGIVPVVRSSLLFSSNLGGGWGVNRGNSNVVTVLADGVSCGGDCDVWGPRAPWRFYLTETPCLPEAGLALTPTSMTIP